MSEPDYIPSEQYLEFNWEESKGRDGRLMSEHKHAWRIMLRGKELTIYCNCDENTNEYLTWSETVEILNNPTVKDIIDAVIRRRDEDS